MWIVLGWKESDWFAVNVCVRQGFVMAQWYFTLHEWSSKRRSLGAELADENGSGGKLLFVFPALI